jgi:hypothetical protein
MQYGVSFENFEELLLSYPLVSSAKKLVGGEISESLRLKVIAAQTELCTWPL